MRKIGRRGISLLLVVMMLVTLLPTAYAEPASDNSFAVPSGKYLISQTNYQIADGVTEKHVIINNLEGTDQVKGYLTTVSPDAKAEFKASYSGYYTKGSTTESRADKASSLSHDMKAVTKQAADFETATGRNVIMASNADYYDMQTGQPCGYLIMEGNVVQTSNGSTNEPYFAVLKDGSYAIRDYGTDHSDVVEAISGPFYLVKNSEIVAAVENVRAPRNSIGLKADGTVVMFLADGRQGVSNGMTMYEVAEIMKQQGCVNAIYLDGGGSATIASKHEGSSKLTIQNTPSDGMERVVSSALLLVSTAEGSGKFDHAALTPNNEVYIANSTVEFEAVGVDTAGFPVDIPSNVKWELPDASFGSIDSKGIFKSSGKCGSVTVNLKQGSSVVGSTTIEIQEPDELYFASSSLNLRFNAESDLGLSVRYKQRDVNLSGVDLDWKIVGDNVGQVKNNKLVTIKAKEQMNATITVSYTKADGTVLTDTVAVEVGKMPQVLFDFEPDTSGKISKGIAEYDWGKKIGSGYMPTVNPLTYFAWDDEADAPGMITKEGPFFFDGTYIEPDPAARDLCYYPAASIFGAEGYDFFTDHTSYMQDYSVSGDIVTADNGHVRFGDYALRWDYNFEDLKPGYKNVNMWLKSTKAVEIEGTPTGLGMWVYAPEGTENFWLWMYINYYNADGKLTGCYKHFKTQEGRSIQYNGIYWEGWMYVEADLSDLAQYVTPERPLSIQPGRIFLNITFIPGGSSNENGDKIPMGDFTKGSIYIDNIRAVYGDTVDDMQSPEFSAVTANGAEIAEDNTTVVKDSEVTLKAAFADPESENASGISTAKTALYVDGLKQTLSVNTESAAECKLTLANGSHSVRFVISDVFGNVTSVTRFITVNDPDSTHGTMTLVGESSAPVGREYVLTLNASGYEKLSALSADIAINSTFGDPVVTFSEGYTGTSKLENGVLHIDAAVSEAAKSAEAAKITFSVPASLARGSQLTYELTTGTFTEGETVFTTAQPKMTVGVAAEYELSASIMTAGAKGTITVAKADGSAAGRVEIYAVTEGEADELIGKTNSAGTLITNRFCRTVGEKFTIYAIDSEGGRSFYYDGTTYGRGNDEVTPTNIRLNAVKDPATTQSISWFSAPEYTDNEAVVQYVGKAAYESGNYTFKTATGTCKTYSFTGDNSSSQINSVTLTGLMPGTTYFYRVGDGISGHWSELSEFTTDVAKSDTSFFVLGDTQLLGNMAADAEDIATMNAVAEKIQNADVNFGIQTGDFIDDAGKLGSWNEILTVFGNNYGNLPVIQVMGNHEYYGNTSGSIGEAAFDVPDEDYYSVEYGNVYVAVINCNANLEAAAKWLVDDAAKSDCEWKVLTLHQPPYYTNPKGSSAAYNEHIPSAVDAAGIDFVFSGHDHAYARTEPLTGGAVDKENGAVYFITGDLGEKSRSNEYAPDDNPDFHFAMIDQTYDALYFIANTNGNTMTVTAYNVDGSIVDSYTMKHLDACDRSGHKMVHTNGTLKCSVCGDAAEKDYTGIATDSKTGKMMYFIGGQFKTGWFVVDTEIYHFDKNGLAHKVTVKEDVKTNCTTQGHKTVVCECKETYTLKYGNPIGHDFVENTADDGTVYYVCANCGELSSNGLRFNDVKPGAWYEEAVIYCFHNDYIRGVTATEFEPNMDITREMLVTILWRMSGAPDPVKASPFTDGCHSYASRAIRWASENNIVNGRTETTFDPYASCSRQEMVTIFYRYAQFIKADVSKTTDIAKTFADASKISNFAKDAVAWSVANDIINGFTDPNTKVVTFQPNGTATRAQVAKVIMQFMETVAK